VIIYLYCNNLETISQQNIQYNLLREEYLKLLEQKYSLIEFKGKYLELLNSFQLLQDGLDQNVENIEFIGDHFEHLVHAEDFLGHLTDSSDSGYNS
jgi:hypothetical protein